MKFELSITRDIPFSEIPICPFRCWTEPELLKQWFCPTPWKVTDADLDPRPGGRFNTTMVGPEGEEFHHKGSFLEVVEGKKVVFTTSLLEGWEPVTDQADDENAFPFIGIVTFDDLGDGNLRYTARAIHWTQDARDRHAAMGFEDGWNKALDQMLELSEQKPRHRNPVGWFEIYVTDLERSIDFYEKVFDLKLEQLSSPTDDIELYAFPGSPEKGGATGALCKMDGCEPGGSGTIVYFSCSDCAIEESRVLENGGHVVKTKFSIGEYGDIALVTDPDGNMIGLHNPPEGGGC